MKTLKLNVWASENLSKVEMNRIAGGGNDPCCCACAYANNGGSSVKDNGQANEKKGADSKQAPKAVCVDGIVFYV